MWSLGFSKIRVGWLLYHLYLQIIAYAKNKVHLENANNNKNNMYIRGLRKKNVGDNESLFVSTQIYFGL